MSDWFNNLKTPKINKDESDAKQKGHENEKSVRVPEGFWVKCSSCGEILQSNNLKDNLRVCPECGFHFRLSAWERIENLTDEGSFTEMDSSLRSNDPLEFVDTKGYTARLKSAGESTRQNDAIVTGQGTILGVKAMIGAFEFKFMGGSMGVVVGEKITRLFEAGLKKKIPVILVSSSGGARMQEGIFSLMQLAKTSALVGKLRENRVPFISLLADPTTGGVAASFAMLGDIIIAEPGALIGFAGPRVIEQTIRQNLPPGFQRSEFLLKHGFVDLIVERQNLPKTIAQLLTLLQQGLWSSSRQKK